jgi:hypothetical protein
MTVNYPEKIITLWAVFLLGLLFHTQLGLMPLFHGISVAEFHAQSVAELAIVFWLMLAFFAVPMIVMITTLFYDSKRYRKIHLAITYIYSVLNLCHVIADLFVKPIIWYQIALMVMLFAIGLLLNLVSSQWLQERRSVTSI